MSPSWEEMAIQVVAHGRPGDLKSAALGWEALLRNLNSVKTSLDTNVTDLGESWKGDAYDAFKTHIAQISQKIQDLNDEANRQGTIVGSLNESARLIEDAQRNFPIPNAALGDILEARNGHVDVPSGFFDYKLKLEAGFFESGPVEFINSIGDSVRDVFTRESEDAERIWKALDGNVRTESNNTPQGIYANPTPSKVSEDGAYDTSSPGGGASGVAGGGGAGGGAKTPSMNPPGVGSVSPPGVGSPPGIGDDMPPIAKTPSIDTGTGGFDPEIGSGSPPGTGSIDPADRRGTGLAGAGGGIGSGGGVGGLGSGGGLGSAGGIGTGGLGAGGGASGLGSGGGIGAGGIPGGGSLGKGVSAGAGGLAGMGAGAGAGAGKGAGKGGAGKGGKPSLSGGVAGGAGKGGAGRPGAGGLGGGQGAGFGNEEERSTWLQEDDDVWGGGDAAPGVLR
ncbi:WXG100 family type VII secretion target [Catenuloplanes sp. NPDC051500]|uniref:WXG100 family type VII secretion target n=1 Tax=Catenuloplanes sp. NPDC051500 TaxID=3363959 RepID=UPI003791AB98